MKSVHSLLLCLLAAAATLITAATIPTGFSDSERDLTAYQYGPLAAKFQKRSVDSTFVVTGAAGGGQYGSKPIRYEIRQLEKQELTWTLYMLGLDWLQYTNQSDPLSWYQLMGMSTVRALEGDVLTPLRYPR